MSADAHNIQVRRDRQAVARFRDLLRSERQSAALYRGLAAGATGERRQIFLELAAAEERHAAHWAAKLTALGERVPESGRPMLRTRLLSWLARRFSVDTVLPFVERAEHSDAGLYDGDPHAAPEMAVDERSHARVLTRMRDQEQGGTGGPGSSRGITRHEPWHRSDRSGALRAAGGGTNPSGAASPLAARWNHTPSSKQVRTHERAARTSPQWEWTALLPEIRTSSNA